tara:strand:- start:150 stop:614 length:465 start_codon:yes stop_codon:yes gene_type:complete
MQNLRENLLSFLNENLKTKNQIAVSTCRLMLAAIKDRDIQNRSTNSEGKISDVEIFNLFQGMIKQRKESMKIYQDAGRKELCEREKAEIEVINIFLPEQKSEEDLIRIINDEKEKINANSIKDLGKLISVLKEKYPGEIDMKKTAEFAKKILSK